MKLCESVAHRRRNDQSLASQTIKSEQCLQSMLSLMSLLLTMQMNQLPLHSYQKKQLLSLLLLVLILEVAMSTQQNVHTKTKEDFKLEQQQHN